MPLRDGLMLGKLKEPTIVCWVVVDLDLPFKTSIQQMVIIPVSLKVLPWCFVPVRVRLQSRLTQSVTSGAKR